VSARDPRDPHDPHDPRKSHDPHDPDRRGPRPPALARLLLRWRLPGAVGDALAGDLAERYARDVRERGRIRARGRYWRDALSPSLRRLRREALDLDPTRGASVASTQSEPLPAVLLRDVRHSLRSLAKSPLFTTVAVLSLAIGIGPNTAIFSVVDAILLAPPEGSEPEELVDVYNRGSDGSWYYSYVSLVERLREEGGDVFEGVAAWVIQNAAVEEDGVPSPVVYELVTGNYFDVLGIDPARGRFFTPEEDATPGTHPVTVVSHPFWRDRLAEDPGVVGSTLRINGRPYTVVGVAPDGFTGKALPGAQADLWIPYSMYPHIAPGQPSNGNLGITARVRDGVETPTAVAAVETIGARIDAERKARGSESDFVTGAFPWTEIYLDPDADGFLLAASGFLLAVVGLVLVVACVNLAGFLLARATDRRREVAVRLAMGAGRGAIVRRFLIESLLLGMAGGAVGLGLGLWTARALVGIEPPIPLPLALDVGLDGKVLAFTAGVSVLAGLLFGLTPAIQASRSPVATVLRDEGNAVAGSAGRGIGLRGLLVVGQTAISVVLLVGAGLFARSLLEAGGIDPGFDTGPAAVVQVDGGGSGYTSADSLAPVLDRALAGLATRPEVDHAALVTRAPLELGTWVTLYDVPGVDPPPGRDSHRIEYTVVSPSYFETMGIDLLAGRGFVEADGPDAPPVVVVSRALAESFWPGASAVGRTLLPTSNPESPVTVVGVADDVAVWSVDEPPRPYLYRSFAQSPSTSAKVVARGGVPPEQLARTVADALRAEDPELFLPSVGTMEEHLGMTLFLPRMAAILIGAFALLALAISAMGLYGLVSYGVARRTREMGIRISLGARATDVVRLVVARGLGLAVAGAAIGVVAAMALAHLLAEWLIGVRPWDPVTLVGVPLVLLAVATVAALLPARRASRVDPSEALRAE